MMIMLFKHVVVDIYYSIMSNNRTGEISFTTIKIKHELFMIARKLN